MKPETIFLNIDEMDAFERLKPMEGEAWKLWKKIFADRGIAINGSKKLIPHVRWVKGNQFTLQYSARKITKVNGQQWQHTRARAA